MPITVLFSGLPTRTMSQTVYDAAAEAYMAGLPTWGTQANALETNVNAKEAAASASAAAALTYKNNSQTSAQSSYDNALISIDAAANSATARNQAQAARDAAQAYAAALVGTSTTSLVIGAGSKVFGGAGLAGKQFYVGQRVRAANPANTAQRMDGVVATYTNNGASSSLTITVDNVNPATNGNTVANWGIGPGGEVGGPGAAGSLAGGSMTGALNLLRATGVPISSSPDIWSAAGNWMYIFGAGTITGFPNAPQSGSQRTLKFDSAVTFVESANMIVFGGSQTFAAGDLVDVTAENPNLFIVYPRKRSGLATNDGGYMQVQDQKASGTGGGIGPSINTEMTRVINTTVSNSIPGASLSSNQLTLTVAGTYDIVFRTPGNLRHRARLYDVTNAATAIIGQSATVSGGGISIGERRVTITGTTVFEIRDFFTQDSTDGTDLGRAASQSGVSEIYTSMQIRKVG